MIERDLKERLLYLSTKFPVVSVSGPRQSGKTTLLKNAFPDYTYVSLENLNNFEFADNDPVGFLSTYDDKVILDEVQRVSKLFNYLQGKIDESNQVGQYLISGSQNFLMMENITQSLAGRVGLLALLPLSYHEVCEGGLDADDLRTNLFKGGYPRLYAQDILPVEFYPSYVSTYLERDVRTLTAVQSLVTFQNFLSLCAGRIGNILDVSNLALSAGVDIKTCKNWLSILNASYLVDFLQPYFKNFNKRLVKRPKLYFTDTGLVSYLLGLSSEKEVGLSAFYGPLFENYVYLELKKFLNLQPSMSHVWFWNETATNEVDFIFGPEHDLKVVEVKSSATYDIKWFKSMKIFCELASVKPENKYVVYAGDELIKTSNGTIVPWKKWSEVLTDNFSV